VLSPNDENAAPIIHYLQTKGVKAKTFPVTGQDATLVGLQGIHNGYQCGTAGDLPGGPGRRGASHVPQWRTRRPRWRTAAPRTRPRAWTFLRALDAEVGTSSNMNSTVIANNFVPASQLCTAK
jgi:D-xylose transport system substrate-binding protein